MLEYFLLIVGVVSIGAIAFKLTTTISDKFSKINENIETNYSKKIEELLK